MKNNTLFKILILLVFSIFIFNDKVKAVEEYQASVISDGDVVADSGIYFNNKLFRTLKLSATINGGTYVGICVDPGLDFPSTAQSATCVKLEPDENPYVYYAYNHRNEATDLVFDIALRLATIQDGHPVDSSKEEYVAFYQIASQCRNSYSTCNPIIAFTGNTQAFKDAIKFLGGYETSKTTTTSTTATNEKIGNVSYSLISKDCGSNTAVYLITFDAKPSKTPSATCEEGCTAANVSTTNSDTKFKVTITMPSPKENTCNTSYKFKIIYSDAETIATDNGDTNVFLCTTSTKRYQRALVETNLDVFGGSTGGGIDTGSGASKTYEISDSSPCGDCDSKCCQPGATIESLTTIDIHNCCSDNTVSTYDEPTLDEMFCDNKNVAKSLPRCKGSSSDEIETEATDFDVEGTGVNSDGENHQNDTLGKSASDYCAMYCTERIRVETPTSTQTASGKYFSLSAFKITDKYRNLDKTIDGQEGYSKTPFVQEVRRCRIKIKFDQWNDDYIEAIVMEKNAYNEYQKYRAYYDFYSNISDTTEKYINTSITSQVSGSCMTSQTGCGCTPDGYGGCSSHPDPCYDAKSFSVTSSTSDSEISGQNRYNTYEIQDKTVYYYSLRLNDGYYENKKAGYGTTPGFSSYELIYDIEQSTLNQKIKKNTNKNYFIDLTEIESIADAINDNLDSKISKKEDQIEASYPLGCYFSDDAYSKYVTPSSLIGSSHTEYVQDDSSLDSSSKNSTEKSSIKWTASENGERNYSSAYDIHSNDNICKILNQAQTFIDEVSQNKYVSNGHNYNITNNYDYIKNYKCGTFYYYDGTYYDASLGERPYYNNYEVFDKIIVSGNEPLNYGQITSMFNTLYSTAEELYDTAASIVDDLERYLHQCDYYFNVGIGGEVSVDGVSGLKNTDEHGKTINAISSPGTTGTVTNNSYNHVLSGYTKDDDGIDNINNDSANITSPHYKLNEVQNQFSYEQVVADITGSPQLMVDEVDLNGVYEIKKSGSTDLDSDKIVCQIRAAAAGNNYNTIALVENENDVSDPNYDTKTYKSGAVPSKVFRISNNSTSSDSINPCHSTNEKQGSSCAPTKEVTIDKKFTTDGSFTVTCNWEEKNQHLYTVYSSGLVKTQDEVTTKITQDPVTNHYYQVETTLKAFEGYYETFWDLTGLGSHVAKNQNSEKIYKNYSTIDEIFQNESNTCALDQRQQGEVVHDNYDDSTDTVTKVEHAATFTCTVRIENELIRVGKCEETYDDAGAVTEIVSSNAEAKANCQSNVDKYAFYFKIADPSNLFPTASSGTTNEMPREQVTYSTSTSNDTTYSGDYYALNWFDTKENAELIAKSNAMAHDLGIDSTTYKDADQNKADIIENKTFYDSTQGIGVVVRNEIESDGAEDKTYAPENLTYSVTLNTNSINAIKEYNKSMENSNIGYNSYQLYNCKCYTADYFNTEANKSDPDTYFDLCIECKSQFLDALSNSNESNSTNSAISFLKSDLKNTAIASGLSDLRKQYDDVLKEEFSDDTQTKLKNGEVRKIKRKYTTEEIHKTVCYYLKRNNRHYYVDGLTNQEVTQEWKDWDCDTYLKKVNQS